MSTNGHLVQLVLRENFWVCKGSYGRKGDRARHATPYRSRSERGTGGSSSPSMQTGKEKKTKTNKKKLSKKTGEEMVMRWVSFLSVCR